MNDSETTDRSVSFTADDRAFVYAVVRRIVRDEDDAHDATQDALLSAFRHRASFAGLARYRTWLYRVAVTSALSQLRRGRQRWRYCTLDATDGAHELATSADTPEVALAAAESKSIVRDHLDRLDPRYAQVLRLRLDDDLAEAEVAKALGLTVATVKIRGFRARQALRTSLAAAL